MALLSLSEEYSNRLENYIYDVTDHMDKIKTYADQCSSITELGISNVCATFALMMGKPATLTSYDAAPVEPKEVDRNDLVALALENGITYSFVEEDPTTVSIDSTDLLFIHETLDYSRLATQLSLHGNKASKFIIVPMFDVDRDSFRQAINSFVDANPSWEILEDVVAWCDYVVLGK
jgi:hypothetical protein